MCFLRFTANCHRLASNCQSCHSIKGWHYEMKQDQFFYITSISFYRTKLCALVFSQVFAEFLMIHRHQSVIFCCTLSVVFMVATPEEKFNKLQFLGLVGQLVVFYLFRCMYVHVF